MTAPSPKLPRLVEALRRRAPRKGDSVHSQRSNFEIAVAAMSTADGVIVQPVTAGGVPAEWLAADVEAPAGTILWFHGGGYVIGSLATIRPMASQLAVAAKTRVLTLDYRLAPEHPHPAAVDDAVAAYRWLLDDGVEPATIAFGGDSAGGGLVAAALVAARDGGLALPAAGVLVSPWTDLTLSGSTLDTNAQSDPQVQRWLLAGMAEHYLAGQAPTTPLASPAHADLNGLPPLLIHVGGAEGLLDDARGFARAAEAAGVDVTLETWPHMIHVWHSFAPVLPEAVAGLARIGEWLGGRWSDAAADDDLQ